MLSRSQQISIILLKMLELFVAVHLFIQVCLLFVVVWGHGCFLLLFLR